MRLTAWIAAVVLAGACGETPSKVSLCGTDDSVGFIAIVGLAPGQECCPPPSLLGMDVLGEIGSPYIAIGKSCEFWFYSSVGPRGEPEGVVYTGRLSATQASEISEMLQLEAWEALGPVHGVCCVFHFPPSSYHWGSNTVAWAATSTDIRKTHVRNCDTPVKPGRFKSKTKSPSPAARAS